MHAQTLGNLCNCLAVKSDQLLAIGCSAVNVQPLMLSSHKRVTILLTANTIFTPCLKIILLFVHQNSTFKDKRSNEHTSGRFCNGGLEAFSCGFPRYQPAVSSEDILSFAFHFWQNLQQMENFFTSLHWAHRRSSAQQGLPSSAVFLDGVVGVYPQHDYNVFYCHKVYTGFVYIAHTNTI